MSTQTPTLADVIDAFIAAEMVGQFVAVPGRVVSYDAAKQTAVVEPMCKRVSRDAEDDRIIDTLPILSDVPVAWPRGGGYFVHLPLQAGDSGLLVFTDTDIGAWRASGQVSDPGDERLHALGGAVFYPGLETVDRPIADASADHLVIGKDGGPAIHVDGSTVQLGAAGGSPVALGPTTDAWFSAIKSAVAGAADFAAFKTAVAAISIGSVAATKAKAT